MTFIKKPPEKVTREFQLDEPLAQTLDSYAQFIDAAPDHIVASALRFVFSRDKEFDRLQKEQKRLRTSNVFADGSSRQSSSSRPWRH